MAKSIINEVAMKKIPIVFASDENYITPTYIAMYSALCNMNPTHYYDFFLLCPNTISSISRDVLYSLETEFNRCSIKIIDMGNSFSNIKMKIDHISSPTFYRLCLPDILSEYEKCIYLDSDIIVNGDLGELFDTVIDEYYLAGVLSEGIQLDKYYKKILCKRTGLKDVNSYINAGVLLFNLNKLRNDGITQQWFNLINKEFPTQDQDIINLSCYGKIKLLPLKFNAMTKCEAIKCNENNITDKVYDIDEIKEARHNPIIIHFADRIKPWSDKASLLANYWWQYYYQIENIKARTYIRVFIDGCCNNTPKSQGNFLKQKLIRISQVLGIYAFFKQVEDIFKIRRKKN